MSVNQGVTDARGWQAGADLDGLIAAGNGAPQGIWSDGTTAWVADIADDKIYAYRLSGGTRDAGRDITLADAKTMHPQWHLVRRDDRCGWRTGRDAKIYAYQLSDGTRDAGQDITLASLAGNDDPRGIWSDGTTLWVADFALADLAKFYAYRTVRRDAGRRPGHQHAGRDRQRSYATGIWSDGTTLWVADSARRQDLRLPAVRRDAGRRPGHHAGGRQRLSEWASGPTGRPCGWRT